MLVIDPAKRYSIEQIKNHKWMQMEGGEPSPVASPVSDIPKPVGEFNEQALRLMQSLGIDQQRTIEVRGGTVPHKLGMQEPVNSVKFWPSNEVPI